MNYPKLTRVYISVVIALGAACIALSFLPADYTKIDVHFALLFVFTVAIGSRITLQIPRFKSFISASETFIFLALLTFGGEFAVILAAAVGSFDAVSSSPEQRRCPISRSDQKFVSEP